MTIRSTDGVFGPTLMVRGALRGAAAVQIDGGFEGDVELDGRLVVGPSGSVTGPIRAAEVEVFGEVVGTVAGQSVVLRSTARVHGDVRAMALTIDDGASLDGIIEMSGEDGAR